MNTETPAHQTDNLLSDAQRTPAPDDGSRPAAGRSRHSRHHTFRRKGPRSALNLARKLRAGQQLSLDQELQLAITCRLATHLFNASLALYERGECREDGEPRQLLGRLLELEKAIRENLARLFPQEQDDPLSVLMRGAQR